MISGSRTSSHWSPPTCSSQSEYGDNDVQANMAHAETMQVLAEMKGGGYTAKQLKDVNFSAEELKNNGYSATELREGTFTAKDL